jgi:hypothetical protein
MMQALDGLSDSVQLPKQLRQQIELLRHTTEHWDDAPERTGRWKTLVEKHGEYASPWTVEAAYTDIWIGPDKLSLQELEQILAGLLDELRNLDIGAPECVQGLTAAGGEASLAVSPRVTAVLAGATAVLALATIILAVATRRMAKDEHLQLEVRRTRSGVGIAVFSQRREIVRRRLLQGVE